MSSDTPINECSLPPEWSVALDRYEPGYGPVRTYIRDLHSDLAAMTARAEAAERDAEAARQALNYNLGIANKTTRSAMKEREDVAIDAAREGSDAATGRPHPPTS